MPKLFRSMISENGKPKVGTESKMLGVRIAPNPNADIPVDGNGHVQPQTGGMSVRSNWRKLPYFLIPKRLRPLVPKACGSNNLVCWSIGTGPFLSGDLTNNLLFRPDPDDATVHGFVEPKDEMSIEELQDALAQTRDQWVNGED
jgi:hypothetical protein